MFIERDGDRERFTWAFILAFSKFEKVSHSRGLGIQ
ncbi:unnamed protein product [Ectocarpus sp. CCAP 1310/34]|nr:unnamed protein product [Ectocarpus sp. CCAP 1310/34]